MRWRIKLNEYDYDIQYKKGTANTNSDALSRNPVYNIQEFTTLSKNPYSDKLNVDSGSRNVQKMPDCPDRSSVTQSATRHESSTLEDFEIDQMVATAFFPSESRVFSRIQNNTTKTDVTNTETENTKQTECHQRSCKRTAVHLLVGTNEKDAKKRKLTETVKETHTNTNDTGCLQRSCKRTAVHLLECTYEENIKKRKITEKAVRPINPDLGRRVRKDTHSNCVEAVSPGDDHDQRLKRYTKEKITIHDTHTKKLKTNINDKDNPVITPIHIYPITKTQKDTQTLPSKPRIFYNKDELYMRRDHLIYFTGLDCQVTSQVGKKLLHNGKLILEAMTTSDTRVGEAVGFPYCKDNYIFNLHIKEIYYEIPDLINIEKSFVSLKCILDNLNIKRFSISQNNNDLDDYEWYHIEHLLKKIFNDSKYIITVCSGEIMIPVEFERDNIIREYHESTVGGHKGIVSCYHKIRENFYWPGLFKQVENFIRSCESCQKYKSPHERTKMPMCLTDTPKRAFDKVQMDIVGPLTITETGYRYILTIQCHLTKYSDAIPIKNIDTLTVAGAFAEQFITRFGCPRAIHSDQGGNFISKMYQQICKIFKIQRMTSTAKHHQSLGSLERAHRVFVEYLRHYCTIRDWDKWIRYCIFSYNTSFKESTGFTPHELVFGTPDRIPSEFAKEQIPRTYQDYLDDLLTRLTTTQATAAENLDRSKERAKKYYDRDCNIKDFKIDDSVYIYNEPKPPKFEERWEGPFTVTDVFEESNDVELALEKNKSKIAHMNRLKLANIRLEPLPN